MRVHVFTYDSERIITNGIGSQRRLLRLEKEYYLERLVESGGMFEVEACINLGSESCWMPAFAIRSLIFFSKSSIRVPISSIRFRI